MGYVGSSTTGVFIANNGNNAFTSSISVEDIITESIYSVSASIGYPSITPATNNLIVSGSVGIGASSTSYKLDVMGGDVAIMSAGSGFRVKEGSNARMGTATLSLGSVTVNTTAVTNNSRIFLTINEPGGSAGSARVSTRTAGSSFTITSSSALDASTVAWIIIEPA